MNVVDILKDASAIEEDGDITYIGYIAPLATTISDATKEATAAWAIKCIEVVAGITTIKFPNGLKTHSFKWEDRKTLTYKY